MLGQMIVNVEWESRAIFLTIYDDLYKTYDDLYKTKCYEPLQKLRVRLRPCKIDLNPPVTLCY